MTKTYSPEDVRVIIGPYIISTFETVEVARNEDAFSHKAPAAGEVTRVKNANKLGKVTLTLPHTTPDNVSIMAEYEAILTDYATGRFTEIAVEDLLGQSKHKIIEGTVLKVPDSTYEKDATDRVWVIEGELYDNQVRGTQVISVP